MASAAASAIAEELAAGRVLLLDGATGTELERRGAPMSEAAWCALATASHGALLRAIHEDYIRAGARVITANTFASNPIMLAAAGCGERFTELNRRAVEIALEARERAAGATPVAVAGSLSHMVPMVAGSDERDWARIPPLEQCARAFERMAATLAAAGADLILLEMMHDPPLARAAVAAARATGLPFWVGYSARADRRGEPVSFSRPDLPLAAMLEAIPAQGAAAAGIMHTHLELTARVVPRLAERLACPIAAYPDSGRFEMPRWRPDPALTPARFAAAARAWIEAGARIVGGCCGVGPAHIEALAGELARG